MSLKPRNPAINLIVSFLRKKYEDNEIAMYTDLENISYGCTKIYRSQLSQAIEKIKRNEGYLFECVNNVGYKPLYDTDAVKTIVKKRSRKIESQTNMFSVDMGCVNVTNLNDEQRKNYWMGLSKLGALQLVTHKSIDERISKIVNTSSISKSIDYNQVAITALKGCF